MTLQDHRIDGQGLTKRFEHLEVFDTVVIAVSGGSDSMALFGLVLDWAGTQTRKAPRIIAATVDHGLRDGSASEARQVRRWVLKQRCEHWTLRWSGPKPTHGIQERARQQRYRLLCTMASGLGGRTIMLTAHTRDDQAETVLMRLARGSGPDGLAAVAERTSLFGVQVSRPLLEVGRCELRAYLHQQQQDWIEDPSNLSVDFERIRVRQAAPARKDLGLSDTALRRTAARMARARQALECVTKDQLAAAISANEMALKCGCFEWSAGMAQLPAEIGIRMLRRVLFALGGQALPPALGKTERLFDELRSDQFAGATLGGCSLTAPVARSSGQITIYREIGRDGLPSLTLQPGSTAVWDRRFYVEVPVAQGRQMTVRAFDAAAAEAGAPEHHPQMAWPLPKRAIRALPAIWSGDELVSVPPLGWARGAVGEIISPHCNFVVQNFLTGYDEHLLTAGELPEPDNKN